jgi:hypothetical protein
MSPPIAGGGGTASPGRKRADEQVARVRIGVHERMDEDLLHVDPVERPRHLRARDPRPFERREVADLQIADVLQGERAAGAPVPEHLGDTDALVVREVLGEALGVAPLGREIELGAGRVPDLLGQPVEVHPEADAARHLEQADGEGGGREVGLHQHVDARPEHFDHDLLPRGQARPVHLGEGRRADRIGLDRGEHLRERPPEVLLDLPRNVREAGRRAPRRTAPA